MKPHCDDAEDRAEEPKDFLARWSEEPSFRDYETHVALWCALERKGFVDIRLRCEPHERPHNVWRFTMRRGERHTTFISVENDIRGACKNLGYSLGKDFVTAMISGPRARGAFILPGHPRRKGDGTEPAQQCASAHQK